MKRYLAFFLVAIICMSVGLPAEDAVLDWGAVQKQIKEIIGDKEPSDPLRKIVSDWAEKNAVGKRMIVSGITSGPASQGRDGHYTLQVYNLKGEQFTAIARFAPESSKDLADIKTAMLGKQDSKGRLKYTSGTFIKLEGEVTHITADNNVPGVVMKNCRIVKTENLADMNVWVKR